MELAITINSFHILVKMSFCGKFFVQMTFYGKLRQSRINKTFGIFLHIIIYDTAKHEVGFLLTIYH